MAIPPHAPELRPWVENVAGLIGDPVKRLRFLRTVAPIVDVRGLRGRRRWLRLRFVLPVLAAGMAVGYWIASRPRPAKVRPAPAARTAHSTPVNVRPNANVWPVERSRDSETYSNGLRIENGFAVPHHPRSYLGFPVSGGRPVQRSEIAGIVFHSTESQLAPFEAGHNETLKKIGESLLDYIRRRRSYHFLIDRFGRVYRVVSETDAANHAGYSVWADEQWLYINLNESFLGVAFESQTRGHEAEGEMTEGQVRSAIMLTEMLRTKYRIAVVNCVTHAQVSVNPSNMRIGYHVDWASQFPFEDLGLGNNYAAALPAIWAFGFESDPAFLSAATGKIRVGLVAAGDRLTREAAAAGLGAAAYRKRLQQQYHEKLAAVRHAGSAVESDRQ